MAVPLLIFEITQIKKRYQVNRFALIIGSIFPDLIDKSMLFLSLGSGRGISHTLLFVSLAFGFLFLITKGNKAISFPFLIGEIFHLILDLPDIPLFYPFIPYDLTMVHDPIPLWINTLLTEPKVYITEIIGVIILIFILISNKLYSIKEITNYLKTNNNKFSIAEEDHFSSK